MKVATTNQAPPGVAAPSILGKALRHASAVKPQADAATLALDEHGLIRNCNGAGETLFDYGFSELFTQHVSLLLPQLADMELLQDGQPNPHLRYLCRIGHQFQAQRKDGRSFSSEIFLNLIDSEGGGRLSLIVRPAPEIGSAETAPPRRSHR